MKSRNPFRKVTTEADREFIELQKARAEESARQLAEANQRIKELRESMTEAEWEAYQAERTRLATIEYAKAPENVWH